MPGSASLIIVVIGHALEREIDSTMSGNLTLIYFAPTGVIVNVLRMLPDLGWHGDCLFSFENL
jgi:hypothetical protein